MGTLNTTFLPKHDLRAAELGNYAMVKLPEIAMMLVRDGMGKPSVSSAAHSAWYGQAVIHRDDELGKIEVPFAMLVDRRGVVLRAPHEQMELLLNGIVATAPALIADPVSSLAGGPSFMAR